MTIVAGTAVALYWSLYIQPQNGEIVALVLGCLPVAVGLFRYVPSGQYVVQGLLGLLAVVAGGMAPASVLVGTPAGSWLVGSSPLPLALGAAVAVVLAVIVLRRFVPAVVGPATNSPV